MIRIFVYGTLKRGQCRSHILKDQTFCGEATTKPNYKLFSAGSYPCMTLSENGKSISGEVWEIDENCLKVLDRIEGHPRLYKRDSVELNEFDSCISYFYQYSTDNFEEIDKWEQ